MKYVDIKDSKVAGFYSDDIHTSIPETAMPISDEAWKKYLTNQGKYQDYAFEVNTSEGFSTVTDIIVLKTKEQYYIENPDKIEKPKPTLEQRIAALEEIVFKK